MKRALTAFARRLVQSGFRTALLAVALVLLPSLPARASTVTRVLPPDYTPAASFFITNLAVPDEAVFIYAVQDTVPAGWSAVNISDDGAFDAASHTVEWGPFFDSTPRNLTYQAVPPAAAVSPASFSGEGIFNLEDAIPISGPAMVPLSAANVNSATCVMPANYLPGGAFTVTLNIAPGAASAVYAVEEDLPAGWTAANVSDAGSFNPDAGTVQWGPYFDGLPRSLTYTVTPPVDASGTVSFAGTAEFAGISLPIAGQRQLSPVLNALGSAIRSLPASFQPNQWLTVSCAVAPTTNVAIFALQDQPPPGWIVSNISAAGTFDPSNRLVEWGPYFGNQPVTLTYQVLPPAGATGVAAFTGSVTLNNSTQPVTGVSQSTAQALFYGSVVSALPTNYLPGVTLTVTNLATPAAGITIYAIVDTPPAGWTVSNISDDGTFDPTTGSIQWGPFFDNLPRALTYAAISPAHADGMVTFAGTAQFGEASVPITGQRASETSPVFAGSVVCVMVSNYLAGTSVLVFDYVTPPPTAGIYAVQDNLPAGWTATNLSDGGTLDAANGLVQWGPFFDNLPRALSYTAVPPAFVTPATTFVGSAIFDQSSLPITGQRQIFLVPSLPSVHLTWSNPPPLISGAPLGGIELDATANVPGTFRYTPAAGVVLPLGTNVLQVAFIPSDTINYAAANASVKLVVLPAGPPIIVTPSMIALAFPGIPGASYVVQSALAVTGPWANLSGTLLASTSGLILYTDLTLPRPAARFYRTKSVPAP